MFVSHNRPILLMIWIPPAGRPDLDTVDDDVTTDTDGFTAQPPLQGSSRRDTPPLGRATTLPNVRAGPSFTNKESPFRRAYSANDTKAV